MSAEKVFYDDPHFDYRIYWLRRNFEHQTELAIMERLLPGGARLLEVGSGYGRLVPSYQDKYQKIVLLDPSEKLLSQAKVIYGKEKISFQKGVVEALPFRAKSFDTVVMVRVLHHLDDKKVQQALRETYRVLRPGGVLLMEYANKIHMRARIRAWMGGEYSWHKNTDTLDRRTFRNIIGGSISFNNFHPDKIVSWAREAGFSEKVAISASYFRLPFFKYLVPLKILQILERWLEARVSQHYLGPSNFILLEKR